MAIALSVKAVLFIYLLGGITLIPLIIIGLFFLLPSKKASNKSDFQGDLIDSNLKLGEINELKNLKVTKQGLMTVTSKYNTNCFNGEEDTTGLSSLGLDLASFNKLKNNNRYYVNLVHGNLLLYSEDTTENKIIEDESNSLNTIRNSIDLKKILKFISLKDVIVTMWPPTLTEGSLFTKKSSILIIKRSLFDSASNCFKVITSSDQFINNNIFFLQMENNSEKEDWFFAILNALKSSDDNKEPFTGYIKNFGKFNEIPPETYHFKTADVSKLIAINNANLDHINCKWFNLILSRIFLAYKANGKLETLIAEKIKDKLSKISVSFLDEFVINDLQLGGTPPIVSNPKIVKMNLEGDLEIHLDIFFDSKFVLNISTLVTVLNKTYPIELKLDLKKLQGTVILLLKKPPSNRIWFTFSKIPFLDLEIEPVIVNKSFSYGMIVKTLKSKIIDALEETLVYPYFEDINYYQIDNNHSIYKGGLWDFTKFDDYMAEFTKDSKVETSEESHESENSDENDESEDNEKENIKDQEDTISEKNDSDGDHLLNNNTDKKSFRDLLKKRNTNMISSSTQMGLTESDLASLSSNESTNPKKYSTKINTWYKKAKKSASVMIDDIKHDNENEKLVNDDNEPNDKVIETKYLIKKDSIKEEAAIVEPAEENMKYPESVKEEEFTSVSTKQNNSDEEGITRKEVSHTSGAQQLIIDDDSNPFEKYQQIKAESIKLKHEIFQEANYKKEMPKRRPLPPIPSNQTPVLENIINTAEILEDKAEALLEKTNKSIETEQLSEPPIQN